MIRVVMILPLLGLVSCLGTEGIRRFDKPDNLLEKSEMVEVIKEMTKLEAHIQSKYVSVAKYNKVMVNSGDSLLAKMGYTRERLDNSIGYYGSQQDELKEIYQLALEELNKELGQLQSGQN